MTVSVNRYRKARKIADVVWPRVQDVAEGDGGTLEDYDHVVNALRNAAYESTRNGFAGFAGYGECSHETWSLVVELLEEKVSQLS